LRIIFIGDLKVKKFILCVLIAVCLSLQVPVACSASGTINGYYYDYGPFCITESNEACLGNGSCFASVYINKNYPIGACPQANQYLIIVVPNQAILVSGSNYGIQRFGLNYTGDPSTLDIDVLNSDNTIDTGWKLKINYDPTQDEPGGKSFGPFGCFVYDDSGTGSNRKNPLLLHIATNSPIDVYNFYHPNEDMYIFACHIAGFTAPSQGCNITSAMFAQLIPQTLIELVLFAAKPEASKVVITWATASEIDNAGFNIYRAEAESGDYVKINDALIPAEGSPTAGAAYEFVDENVKLWKKYYYILEDIDINGNATVHETVSAMPRLIDLLVQ